MTDGMVCSLSRLELSGIGRAWAFAAVRLLRRELDRQPHTRLADRTYHVRLEGREARQGSLPSEAGASAECPLSGLPPPPRTRGLSRLKAERGGETPPPQG